LILLHEPTHQPPRSTAVAGSQGEFVMAEANFIQEGIDRVESAFKTIEKDFKRFQKRADKRRKQFEKQAEKRVKKFQSEFRNNRIVKRADDLRSDALKAIEDQVDGLLANLRIASHAEIHKLERKVAQLNKKVRELEKLSKLEAA
jgi:hypothetical protein